MMKRLINLILLTLFVLSLVGCSEQVKEVEKKEEIEQIKETDEQQTIEMEKEEEQNSWAGEWVFLSDDNVGTLTIEQVDESHVTYQLSGSRNNPVNGSSYGNAFEGSGTINGNRIEFTNDLSEDCGGIMERKDHIITVTLDNGACHTPQVYLDGDYKKADAYQEQPLFMVKDHEFQIYGLSLEDTPSEAKSLIGNPDFEGPDETGFDEWIQKYSNQYIDRIAYFENNAVSISSEALASELQMSIQEHFNGERYFTEDGAEYLYLPETEQLLIYTPDPEDSTKVTLLLTYADGNFHVGVENGWILKK